MKDNPNKPVRVTFVIHTDEDDAFYGHVESLPGVMSEGPSPGHAILNIAQALLVALEAEQLRLLQGHTTETTFVADPRPTKKRQAD